LTNLILEAYDDGYFPHYFKARRGTTYIVGVEVENEAILRKITIGVVLVDGRETQRVIREMSAGMSGHIVLLDGVIYAGFDVVDPHDLYSSTGKSVLVVQLYPLDLDRIQKALQDHFEDWRERFSIIKTIYSKMIRVDTPWRVVQLYIVGLDFREALAIFKKSCIYSPSPEPLRIADKIASILSKLHVNKLY